MKMLSVRVVYESPLAEHYMEQVMYESPNLS
jgi:hypothetical protein